MPSAATRRLVAVLVVAGALYAPAMTASAQPPAPAPPPGIGAKLLQGPAGGIDDPRAHSYIIDHLAPGTTISRQIGFSNGDSDPVKLSFYATSATISAGTFEVGAGRAANDLTSWITFSPPTATIDPAQTVPVTITIAVPADATTGERYAAALAERTQLAAGGGAINNVSRVGIRLYLSVGPGGAPTTAFTIDSMTAARDAAGNPLLTAQVHNTGERAVDLSGHLQLTEGPSSLSAGPFPVRTVATLLPGDSGTVSIALDPMLPVGPWNAQITLTSGITTEQGTAQLTFPTTNGAPPTATPVTHTQPSRPPTIIIITIAIALTLAAAILGSSLLRRRRKPAPRSTPTNLPVPHAPASVTTRTRH